MCTGNENSKPIWNMFIIRKDIIETSQVVLNFCRTVYNINYLYLLNTIQRILVKVPRAHTHRPTQCFPHVEDSSYILFNLFSFAALQNESFLIQKRKILHIYRCLLIIICLMICEKYWSTISKYMWMYAVPKWRVAELQTWQY